MSSGITFLKKLGQVLLQGVGIATGMGPLILPFLGAGKAGQVATKGLNDLTAIGQVIAQMEVALGGKTGADRFAAGLPLVTSIVRTSELVVGKKVKNEALFIKACEEYTQASADLLNSLHEDEVKTS